MARAPNVLLLVVETDVARTQSLRRELDNAGFETHSSIESAQLGEHRQRPWQRVFPNMCCVVVVWSRNSLRESWFVGRAEQARMRDVLCPLLLDGLSAEDLPVGHQSKICGDLERWTGSPGELPFPAIVQRVHVLARAQFERRLHRRVKWAAMLCTLLLLVAYVVLSQEREDTALQASATVAPERARASDHVQVVADRPPQQKPQAHAGDAGQRSVALEAPARKGESQLPVRTTAKQAMRSAESATKQSESWLGPDWGARVEDAIRACKAGRGDGCDRVGWLHERGTGVRQSFAAALAAYERGCTIGFGTACFDAARMFEHGLGTPRDAERARQRVRRACELHDSEACFAEKKSSIPRAPRSNFEN